MLGTYPLEYASDTGKQTDGNMRGSHGDETFRLGAHEYPNNACGVAERDRPQ